MDPSRNPLGTYDGTKTLHLWVWCGMVLRDCYFLQAKLKVRGLKRMEELEIGMEPYFSNVDHIGTPLFFSSYHTSCSFFLLHQCYSSSWQLNIGVSTLEMSPQVSFPSTLIPRVMTLNIIYSLMISECIYHKLDFSWEPQTHVQPPIQHFHLGVW